MSKIGFIGLGIMGTPMSKNLKKAGYDLLVSDLNEARLKEAADFGIAVAKNAREIAESCDMIITNGQDPYILYDIMDGKPVGTRFAARRKEAAQR